MNAPPFSFDDGSHDMFAADGASQTAPSPPRVEQRMHVVSNMLHDLRAPLSALFGYIALLEGGVGGTLAPAHGAFVRQIRAVADRLDGLVDDMFEVSRQEAGVMRLDIEPRDMAGVCRDVAPLLEALARDRGVRLEIEPTGGPLEARMDASRIERVLINLVHNALKFTPRGGRVRVGVRRCGDRVRCEVSDTGVGIRAEDLPRLFRRYSQLEQGAAQDGTGLGLHICKAIVEAHGGEIGVESTPGVGSNFWFTLPTVSPEPR